MCFRLPDSKDETPPVSELLPPDEALLESINKGDNYSEWILKNLLSAPNTDWAGVVVQLNPWRIKTRTDLSKLKLSGIVFSTSLIEEVKSEQDAQVFLTTWYQTRGSVSCYKKIGKFNIDSIVSFDHANLTHAKCENLFCASFSFERTKLVKATISRSIVTGASFAFADLKEAEFLDCYGESFSKCDKIVSSFNYAILTKARLYQCKFEGASFVGATLIGANLSESDFEGASFDGCNMDQAVLCYATLSGARLASARLTRVNATNANFKYADFESAHLEDAILTGADLRGANFKFAEMKGVQLHGATLDKDIFGQFTSDQIANFYYPDDAANEYIKEIFAYIEDNKNEHAKHAKTFQRGRDIIASFLAPDFSTCEKNKMLIGFIEYGKFPEEHMVSYLFNTSGDTDVTSLRSRLKAVQKRVKQKAAAEAAKAGTGTELRVMPPTLGRRSPDPV